MRLPLPTRFSPRYAVIFIAAVFVGQQLAGTNFFFSMLTALYISLWVAGFNIAGGLVYASGAFIFFNGLLSAIVGLVFKIILLQPGERNLLTPMTTMLCYCAGMGAMMLGAIFCRGFRPQRGLLPAFSSNAEIKRGAIACLIIGEGIVFSGFSHSSGSVGSALVQLNNFPMMAILLATTYEIRQSGGKSSINWIVWTAGGVEFAFAIFNFGKAGMLVGLTAWLIAAWVQRFNFSRAQVFTLIAAATFFNYYLVPYSQLVRTYRAPTAAENLAVVIHYMSDLNGTRQEFLDSLTDYDQASEWHFFDTREPFLDRLIVLAADDYLISFTTHDHTVGLEPTYIAYVNLIPHFIWKDKPVYNIENDYAHALGILDNDDTTTGIAFSPSAEMFHQATWFGVLIVWPMIIFGFFIITDSLAGSALDEPWALLPILSLSHQASDGGVSGTVFLTVYGTLSLLLVVVTTKFVAPLFAKVRTPRNPGPPVPVAESLVPALPSGVR